MVIAHLGIAVASPAWRATALSPRRRWSRRGRARRSRSGPGRCRFDGGRSGRRARTGPRSRPSLAPARRGQAFILLGRRRACSPRRRPRPMKRRSRPLLDGQLYTVLGKPDEEGRWQLRLWWKPFVTLIWLGGALVALGRLARRSSAGCAASAASARRRRWHEARWSSGLPLLLFAVFVRGRRVSGLIAARRHDDPLAAGRQAGAGVRVAAGAPGQPGPRAAPICATASRACSTSSRAGACPASPKRRCLRSSSAAGVEIDGIAIRDRPEDVAAFLAAYGNPFERIGTDPTSSVQLALGSSGCPRPSSSMAGA